METQDDLVEESLELLRTFRVACSRIEAYLGLLSQMRQAAQIPDQGNSPRSDVARDAYVPDVR